MKKTKALDRATKTPNPIGLVSITSRLVSTGTARKPLNNVSGIKMIILA
jgi:hypothetical protein